MAKKQTNTTSVKSSNYGLNRKKRLERHLKKHPEDIQAQAALTINKTVSTRKSSNNKLGWMSSNRTLETILRAKFVGSITKESVTSYARILKFIKNSPFHQLATIVNIDKSVGVVLKHTSKLSNFKKVETAA